ncbi:protein MOR1-like [Salvia splendens]|uniref:protein MOR1-like n=1 Tax=Salvia splendens TaxID=180675 RepID=UPI001C275CA4|nr:protein MOR1-like [Salvia splendens]
MTPLVFSQKASAMTPYLGCRDCFSTKGRQEAKIAKGQGARTRRASLKAVGSVPTEESVSDAPQEIDEYDDLVCPVDTFKPLEKSGFWEGVRASKCCERKWLLLN